MKEQEFDNLIKTKIDNLNNLKDIDVKEDSVWEKINAELPKNRRGLYLIILTSFIVLIGLLCFVFITQNNQVEEKISIPIHHYESTIITDTIIDIKKQVNINRNTIKSKKEHSKTKPQKKVSVINDTVKLEPEIIDTIEVNELKKLTNQTEIEKEIVTEVTTDTKSYIHVYRQGKITGALNYFTLKANGEKIGTISNGEYEIFKVSSGLTEFELKRKTIKIDLEPEKNYYLRTELVFLGKTKFEWVTESFAKKELGTKKAKMHE